jgi:hypothetical protein
MRGHWGKVVDAATWAATEVNAFDVILSSNSLQRECSKFSVENKMTSQRASRMNRLDLDKLDEANEMFLLKTIVRDGMSSDEYISNTTFKCSRVLGAGSRASSPKPTAQHQVEP